MWRTIGKTLLGLLFIAIAVVGFAFANLSQWIALVIFLLGAYILLPKMVKEYINTIGDKLPSLSVFKKKE